jgi:colanic acid/amylovoran biosynthesis glycosyltransferase
MRPPLTVLHHAPVWLPQTEIWLFDQVSQLPEWVENHVFCERTENLDQFPWPRIRSLREAGTLRWYWDKGLRKLGVRNHLGYMAELAKTIRPAIVHSHFGTTGWHDLEVARRTGVRHVVTFYGLDVNHIPMVDPRWRARYRELFAAVDRVLCEGPHMASCIVALGCPERKVRVHHLGVRAAEIPFRPRAWRPGAPLRVLVAATFREKKGIPYAIAALGALRRELPLELTIIGDTSGEPRSQAEKSRILSALGEFDLAGSTRLLGFRTGAELMKEAYEHHVFLAPSITAADGDTEGGAPVVILQMAASGMPIVSTRHCDIPNLLPPSALLAGERDVPGLVERLRWLVQSPGQWQRMAEEARQRIEERFDAEKQGLRLADLYAELVGTDTFSVAEVAASGCS